MATLINGNGNNAVYAQQDADLYAGALGESTRILNVGSKLAYTIEDANTIAVADGVILTKEGRRIQVDVGSVDEFTIPTGAAGVTRYYIIGYHLYTDGSANQKCETFVQLMASESETIPEAEFREGATEVYVSLYRIKQIGLNLDTITALLSVGIALTDMTDVIGDTDISGIGDGTLTGGLNAVNQNLTELGGIRFNEETNYIQVKKNGNWYNKEYYDPLIHALVPIMTSNTTPSGVASASRVAGAGVEAFRAFDNDDTTYWDTGTYATGQSLTYRFVAPVCAKKVSVRATYFSGAGLKDFDIMGSNDGTNYTKLASHTCPNDANLHDFDLNNNNYYEYLTLVATSTTYRDGTDYCITTLQYYGIEQ